MTRPAPEVEAKGNDSTDDLKRLNPGPSVPQGGPISSSLT